MYKEKLFKYSNTKSYHLLYNDLNLKLSLFALAFIIPRANFNLPSISAVFYVIKKVRNWKSYTHAFLGIFFVLT